MDLDFSENCSLFVERMAMKTVSRRKWLVCSKVWANCFLLKSAEESNHGGGYF